MNFDSISPLPPLLQEVAKQTNPNNFMEPYDAVRVKRASELNAQVYEVYNREPLQVLNLLNLTISDLGCTYSADFVYQYLLSVYNPTNNSNDFDWCNNLCQKLYEVRGSVMNMIHLVLQETAERENRLRKEQIKKEQKQAQLNRAQQKENLKTLILISLSLIGCLIFTILIINL